MAKPMELEDSLNLNHGQMNNKENPISITTHTDENIVEVRIYLDFKVQTMKKSSAPSNRISTINNMTYTYEKDLIPKVNRKNTTIMRNNCATKTAYQHPNQISHCFIKLVYQHHSKKPQVVYILKNLNMKIVGPWQFKSNLENQNTQVFIQ